MMNANLDSANGNSSECPRRNCEEGEFEVPIEQRRCATYENPMLPVSKDLLDPALFDETYVSSSVVTGSSMQQGGGGEEGSDESPTSPESVKHLQEGYSIFPPRSPTNDELDYYDPSHSFDSGFSENFEYEPDWHPYSFENSNEDLDTFYNSSPATSIPTYTLFTSNQPQNTYTYTLADYSTDLPSSCSSSRSSSPELIPNSQIETVLPSTVRELQWREACCLLQAYRKGEKMKRRAKQEERRKDAREMVKRRCVGLGRRWRAWDRWIVLEESGLGREIR